MKYWIILLLGMPILASSQGLTAAKIDRKLIQFDDKALASKNYSVHVGGGNADCKPGYVVGGVLAKEKKIIHANIKEVRRLHCHAIEDIE